MHSLYQRNVDASVVRLQARVFERLGIPLTQVKSDNTSHGEWATAIAQAGQDEVVVICDIDAFPVTRDGFEKAVASARRGNVVGLAQTANHLDTAYIYAGPMFMAFRHDIYVALGKPELTESDSWDVAQLLSIKAVEHGIPLDLIFPSAVIEPRWPLANQGVFGIGTFYGGNEFFHLFQSRDSRNLELFKAVAEDVIEGRPLDFARYLDMRRFTKPEERPSLLAKLLRRLEPA